MQRRHYVCQRQQTDYSQGFAVYVPSGSGLTPAQAQRYDNKDISVTGTITSYRGAPQIMVSDPSQVQLASSWESWVLAGSVLVALVWLHRGARARHPAAPYGQQQDAASVASSERPVTPASIPATPKPAPVPIINRPDLDQRYGPALHTVHQAGMASAALLQRRLHVSYATAAYLMQRMEDEGLVGPADRDRPRQVYRAKLRRAIDALSDGDAHGEAAV